MGPASEPVPEGRVAADEDFGGGGERAQRCEQLADQPCRAHPCLADDQRDRRLTLAVHPQIAEPEPLELGAAADERGAGDLAGTPDPGCRERAERAVLRRALARSEGNLSLAARMIGVSRPTLYDLLRQHRLRD